MTPMVQTRPDRSPAGGQRPNRSISPTDDRFRALFETSPGPLFVRSARTERFLAANDAYGRLIGVPAESIPGKDFAQLGIWVHPADFAVVQEALATAHRVDGCEVRLHGPDRPVRRVILSMTPIDGFGELAYLGVVTDVTGRREEAERLGSLFERSPVAIGLSDLGTGLFQQVNAAFASFFERTSAEIVGHSGAELGIWGDPELRAELLRRVVREGSFRNVEACFRGRSGTERVGLVSMDAVEFEGRPAVLGTIIDVTELRSVEGQFRQAQKMEAIGRLAGGIAHDFNNILTAIRGYSELLANDLRPGDPRREDIDEVLKATERASGLTRQLLAFSRRQVLQPAMLDLKETLAGVVKMLHRVIGEDVRLTTQTPAELWAVFADPGQVEQVLLNLAVNARDAMPTGGTLEISLSNLATLPGDADLPAGDYVVMEVRDTGSGMDASVRRRIFEPFFTTKGVGKGTGLGLATVYGIVKQSGGHITVDSVVGRGTTFRIFLPRVEPDAQGNAGAPRSQPMTDDDPRGSERVLLVEDDRAVREWVAEALANAGYLVTAAASADRATELARDPFDLLITDVVMPGQSGRELVQRLQRNGTVGKALLISGYPGDELVDRGLRVDGDFLAKPFSTAALLRKVRGILDRR